MKKIALLTCLVFNTTSLFSQNTEIDPSFYQTWYLYAISEELGETEYYYGEDVPKMILYDDLSFYATDHCWELTGSFEQSNESFNGDFGLTVLNYEKDCVFGDSTSYILELIYEYDDTIPCYLDDDFMTMGVFGSGYGFKNSITLAMPSNELNGINIFPNPTSGIINFQHLSTPIDKATLYSVQGALVKSYSTIEQQLNISEVSSGIYFLILEKDGVSAIKRIVKQ